MATKLTDIYDKFFFLVTDKKILNLELNKAEEILQSLLEHATVEFHTCYQDLTIDYENKCFLVDLTIQEQWILAHYMALAWIRKPLKTESNLREKFGSKDYQRYSPNNRLKELREIKNDIEKDVNKLNKAYQYSNFKGF